MPENTFLILRILFIAVAAAAVCIIAAALIRSLLERRRNNRSPILTVNARIVKKRTQVSHSHQANAGDISGAHGYHTVSSRRYFVTFRTDEGTDIELMLNAVEYESIREGDSGRLTYQGTRYLGFERS